GAVERLQRDPRSVRMAGGDHPLGRLVEAGDAVEHRGLAGTVRSDQGRDVAAARLEGHVVDSREPAEPHGELLDLENRIFLPPPHARRSLASKRGAPRCRSNTIEGVRDEMIPRGRDTMITTMAIPNSSIR